MTLNTAKIIIVESREKAEDVGEIKTSGNLFTIIKLSRYDIMVPFLCRRCGACCRTYTPSMPEWDLLMIARDMNWPGDELFHRYSACRLKKIRGKREPCVFLDIKNRCMIYKHSKRPDVCRLYPFSFGGTAADCDAYLEHRRVLDVLLKNENKFDLYDSSYCPYKERRPFPRGERENTIETLIAAEISKPMRDAFLEMNAYLA